MLFQDLIQTRDGLRVASNLKTGFGFRDEFLGCQVQLVFGKKGPKTSMQGAKCLLQGTWTL